MRSLHMMCLFVCMVLLMAMSGCQRSKGNPVVPGNNALHELPVALAWPAPFTEGESMLAMYQLEVHGADRQVSLQPVGSRSGNVQGLIADLDLTTFLTLSGMSEEMLEVLSFSDPEPGSLRVSMLHRHPFPAPLSTTVPNLTTARADLGYTGRLVVFADLPSGASAGNFTFNFPEGSIIANTDFLINADGYIHPCREGEVGCGVGDAGGSFFPDALGLTANTFPYKLLVDDGARANPQAPTVITGNRYKNNETSLLSNAGSVTGNYELGDGGWTQDNDGGAPTVQLEWTGFDYLHQGQTSQFDLDFALAPEQSLSVQMGLLVKYTDPKKRPVRGANSPDKNFLLPDSAQGECNFAYRLPHSALDSSVVRPASPRYIFQEGLGGDLDLDVLVRDWDSNQASPVPELTGFSFECDETPIALNTVQEGMSALPEPTVAMATGPSSLYISRPSLEASGNHSGDPTDPHVFRGTLTVSESVPAGTYRGMVRFEDPEQAMTESEASDAFRFGLNPAAEVRMTVASSMTMRGGEEEIDTVQVDLNAPIDLFEHGFTIRAPGNASLPQLAAGNTVINRTIDASAQLVAILDSNSLLTSVFQLTSGEPAPPPAGNDELIIVRQPPNPGLSWRANYRTYAPFIIQVTEAACTSGIASVSSVSGSCGDMAIFSAVATNSLGLEPSGWYWDFGDGASPSTSTLANPVVQLTTSGVRSGTVMAFFPSGCEQQSGFGFTYSSSATAAPTFTSGPAGSGQGSGILNCNASVTPDPMICTIASGTELTQDDLPDVGRGSAMVSIPEGVNAPYGGNVGIFFERRAHNARPTVMMVVWNPAGGSENYPQVTRELAAEDFTLTADDRIIDIEAIAVSQGIILAVNAMDMDTFRGKLWILAGRFPLSEATDWDVVQVLDTGEFLAGAPLGAQIGGRQEGTDQLDAVLISPGTGTTSIAVAYPTILTSNRVVRLCIRKVQIVWNSEDTDPQIISGDQHNVTAREDRGYDVSLAHSAQLPSEVALAYQFSDEGESPQLWVAHWNHSATTNAVREDYLLDDEFAGMDIALASLTSGRLAVAYQYGNAATAEIGPDEETGIRFRRALGWIVSEAGDWSDPHDIIAIPAGGGYKYGLDLDLTIHEERPAVSFCELVGIKETSPPLTRLSVAVACSETPTTATSWILRSNISSVYGYEGSLLSLTAEQTGEGYARTVVGAYGRPSYDEEWDYVGAFLLLQNASTW